MFILITLIILFVISILTGVSLYLKRKRRIARESQARKIRKAIRNEINRGIEEHCRDLEKTLRGKFTSEELAPMKKQIEDALKKIRDWRARTSSANREMNVLIDNWKMGRHTEELVLAGKAVLDYIIGRNSYYLTEEDTHQVIIGQIKQEMPRLLTQYYDELLVGAPTDATSYSKLSRLIEDGQSVHRWLSLNKLPKPQKPSNWHAIVDRHVENPDLDDYFYIDSHAEGSIHLMAARAVVEEDVAEAKFLLALSRRKNYYTVARELSPQMCDDLAKIVEREHVRREAARTNN